ncbi:MAG: NADH-quinone oxidoreductase subunit M [Candidatus Hydrogenedentes bacterium]|nr:NADH-quinone oxidoreductase subunit M [Candidatus Hydrogenedentota bacterium]
MTLVWIIAIPLVGGLLAWAAGHRSDTAPRWIALSAMALDLALALGLWKQYGAADFSISGPWLQELHTSWIPQFGISFHLAVDGLSLLLLLLTALLGLLCVPVSWTEIRHRVGFFHFNLLWVLAGILGVFMAADLFLFYCFWELMLIPMYFLIAIWGHERRLYAAMKFFIFTQLSGLFMLVAILGLVFMHHTAAGVFTFNYAELIGTPLSRTISLWLMLGFFAAFAVKLPVVPVHSWLPDAHTEAPTAGSVILAGLLLKTGAYGLLRFVLPLFPVAAGEMASVAMVLAVVGIIYGAVLAFAQTDLKRLVAYSSVSHMGFVLLGVATNNLLALQGAVLQVLCHGLGTGALFILVGALQERIHTRDLRAMGGLWTNAPRMGGVAMFLALASLGLPGLGNFIGEFLVLLGTYQTSIPIAVVASIGLIVSTVYSLWIIQRAFHGVAPETRRVSDFTRREMATMAVLMAGLVWLGLYPQPVINTASQTLTRIQQTVVTAQSKAATVKLVGMSSPRSGEIR